MYFNNYYCTVLTQESLSLSFSCIHGIHATPDYGIGNQFTSGLGYLTTAISAFAVTGTALP